MNKIFTLIAMLFVGLGASAKDITITASDFTPATEADYSTTKEGITVAVEASSVTADQMRIFKGKTMTISSSVGNITKIEFTCTANGAAKYGPGSFNAQDGYTFEESGKVGTWTGSASAVSFTAESNQVRATQIVVTVSGDGGNTKTNTTIEFSGDYLTRFTPGKDGDETLLPIVTVMAGDAAVEGAEVKWTLDMDNNWMMGEEEPSIYNGKVYIPNHSSGNLTLTAKYAGNDTYEASSKKYTLKVYKGYTSIQSVIEDFPEVGSDTWKEKESKWNQGVQVSFWLVDVSEEGVIRGKEALVTYVNGQYTYIQDEYGSLLLYGNNLGFKQGDKVTSSVSYLTVYPPILGGVYGTLKTYNGLLELAVNKEDVEIAVVSSDNPVEPKTITIDQLNQTNLNNFVKIEQAEFVSVDKKNLTFKVGETTLAVFNQWNIDVTALEEGKKYNLEGMGSIYWRNETLTNQLYLVNFEEADDETSIESPDPTLSKGVGTVYNLSGQPATRTYRGVTIQNARKVFRVN